MRWIRPLRSLTLRAATRRFLALVTFCAVAATVVSGLEEPAFEWSYQTWTFHNGVQESAMGDFNGDGVLDVAVLEETQNAFSVMLVDESGGALESFTIPVAYRPTQISVLSGHGRPDQLVIAGDGESGQMHALDLSGADSVTATYAYDLAPDLAGYNQLFIDMTTGRLSAEKEYGSLLFKTDDGVHLLLLTDFSTGDVIYHPIPALPGETPLDVAAADVDGDGVDECVIGLLSEAGDAQEANRRAALVIDPLDGSVADVAMHEIFTPQSALYGQTMTVGDFTGDGLDDLVLWSFISNEYHVFVSTLGDDATYEAPDWADTVTSPLGDVSLCFAQGGYAIDANNDRNMDIVSLIDPMDPALPGALILSFGDGTGGFREPGVVFPAWSSDSVPDVARHTSRLPAVFAVSVPPNEALDVVPRTVLRLVFEPTEVVATALRSLPRVTTTIAPQGSKRPDVVQQRPSTIASAADDGVVDLVIGIRSGATVMPLDTRPAVGAAGSVELGLVLPGIPWLRPTVAVLGGYQWLLPGLNLFDFAGTVGATIPWSPVRFLELHGGVGWGIYQAGLTHYADSDPVQGVANSLITATAGVGLRLGETTVAGVFAEGRFLTGIPPNVGLGLFFTQRSGTPAQRQGVAAAMPPDSFVLRDPLSGGPQHTGRGLVVTEPTIAPIFPVLYKAYETRPIGWMALMNDSNAFVEGVEVGLVCERFIDNPRVVKVASVDPGEEIHIDLYALFNNALVTITEGDRISAEVQITMLYDNEETQIRHPVTLEVLGRNAIVWDDDRKVGAYVTIRDDTVREFATTISRVADTVHSVSTSLQLMVAAYEALRVHGTAYVVDPNSAYEELSRTTGVIDFVQFPTQTLRFKAGDCDDLSVLYAALMESIGVQTAFLLYPGHIFVAGRLELTEAEARRSFSHADDLIYREDGVWLPLEVTALRTSFSDAWATAAAEVRQHEQQGDLSFLRTGDAWSAYPPVELPGSPSPALPTADEISDAYRLEIERLGARESSGLAGPLLDRLAQDRGDYRTRNRLAAVYARYGRIAEATRELRAILATTDYAPALVNLAGIAYLAGDFEQAVEHYRSATALMPDSPAAWAGRALCEYSLGDFEASGASYERLRRLDPQTAQRYAYLDGSAGGRASSATAATVPWHE